MPNVTIDYNSLDRDIEVLTQTVYIKQRWSHVWTEAPDTLRAGDVGIGSDMPTATLVRDYGVTSYRAKPRGRPARDST